MAWELEASLNETEREMERDRLKLVLWATLMICGPLSQAQPHFFMCKVGILTLSWWESLDVGWAQGLEGTVLNILKGLFVRHGAGTSPLPPSLSFSWPLVHLFNGKMGLRT